MAKTNLQENLPVAVYCTVEKKVVMIFSSNRMCDKYVFNNNIYKSSRTRYLTIAKGKSDKNIFNCMLAFRHANVDQKLLLGGLDLLVLDEKYEREDARLHSLIRPNNLRLDS